MLHFSKIFKIFEIHQYFLVKLLNALNFIWTLISPFLAIMLYDHLRFQYESLKIELVVIFFQFSKKTVTSGNNEQSLKISMPCR